MKFYIHNIERSEEQVDEEKGRLTTHFRVHLTLEGRAAIVHLEVAMAEHRIDFVGREDEEWDVGWLTSFEKSELYKEINEEFIMGKEFVLFYNLMKTQFKNEFGVVHSTY